MTLSDEPKPRREMLRETLSGLTRPAMLTFGVILVCLALFYAAVIAHLETPIIIAGFERIDVDFAATWRYAISMVIYGTVGTLTLYAFALPEQ